MGLMKHEATMRTLPARSNGFSWNLASAINSSWKVSKGISGVPWNVMDCTWQRSNNAASA